MTRPECLHSAADNIGDVRYFAVDFKWATCTKCGASIAPEWMLDDANETGDEDVPSPSHGGDDDSNPGCSVDDCWALADVEVSGQPFCGAHAVTPAQAAVLATIDANGGASLISNRTWSSVNTVNWRSVRALERMGILETFLGGDGHYARRTSDPVVTLTLIDGRTYTGTIKSFGATQVSLQTSDGLVTIARSELLSDEIITDSVTGETFVNRYDAQGFTISSTRIETKVAVPCATHNRYHCPEGCPQTFVTKGEAK